MLEIFIPLLIIASGVSGAGARYFARKPLVAELNALDESRMNESVQHTRDLAAIKARHLTEQSELRAALMGQLNDLKQDATVHAANLQGKLEEARIKADRHDYLISKHVWHVGGRGEPHGMGALIQYRCTCGAQVWAPEGYFD